MTDCPFCDWEYLKTDVLVETENFFVKNILAPVSGGHVMIVTKEHLKCFGAMEDKLDKEFLQLKENLTTFIQEMFGNHFFTENGVFGQSVFHAHAHFIPLHGTGVSDVITEMVRPEQIPHEVGGLTVAKRLWKAKGPYTWIQQEEQSYIFPTIDVSEKFHRTNLLYRAFFSSSGVTCRDWHCMTKKEKEISEERRKETKKKFTAFSN
jgi:diadenosine tetraphosphate (Ap4A) HIT family hydrolase